MLQYPTVYGKEDKADETEDPLADDSTDKPEEPSAEVKTPLSWQVAYTMKQIVLIRLMEIVFLL